MATKIDRTSHSRKVVDDCPHRVDQARIRYWHARMLLDRNDPGDRDRAQQLLSEARRLSESMGRHGQIAWIDALLKKAFSLKQRILLTSLTDTRSVSLHLSQFGAGVQWRDVLQASGVVFKMGAMRTALAAPRAESLRSRTENRHPLRRTCRWD